MNRLTVKRDFVQTKKLLSCRKYSAHISVHQRLARDRYVQLLDRKTGQIDVEKKAFLEVKRKSTFSPKP